MKYIIDHQYWNEPVAISTEIQQEEIKLLFLHIESLVGEIYEPSEELGPFNCCMVLQQLGLIQFITEEDHPKQIQPTDAIIDLYWVWNFEKLWSKYQEKISDIKKTLGSEENLIKLIKRRYLFFNRNWEYDSGKMPDESPRQCAYCNVTEASPCFVGDYSTIIHPGAEGISFDKAWNPGSCVCNACWAEKTTENPNQSQSLWV